MPWSASNYPASMKNLPPSQRRKAIEIANALLSRGMPEGRAIAIGISRSRGTGDLKKKRRARERVRQSGGGGG